LIARALYSLLIALLAPVALVMESLRGAPASPHRLAERFGRTGIRAQGSVWLHAVSMGEVQAAAPLVRALIEQYPERTFVMTTTTSTGARRVRELFGTRVQHAYLPLDLPFAIRAFLDRVAPALAIVLETEIWPNLYADCARRRIPLLLASARLSERSVRRYARLQKLLPGLLERTLRMAHICAQSEIDAQRFVALGVRPDRVEVIGNLKFDLGVPAAVLQSGMHLRDQLGDARPVWVAGSTHEGEEAVLLDAHAQVRAHQPSTLLVLVPRHPQRFEAVAAELERQAIAFVRRSEQRLPTSNESVLLVDTMGELMQFYAAGEVAFVGGTLIALGGHNLLEPAALGRPVLCGPHTFNAADIARALEQAGALKVVRTAAELAAELTVLFASADRRGAMGVAGQQVLAANRGACQRLLERAQRLLATEMAA
jgi:3-deoxy-D-manno-octulosonic-acid transferase